MTGDALIGRGVAGGRWRIEEALHGDETRGVYRGRDAAGRPALVTVGTRPTVDPAALSSRLAFAVPGVAALRHLGPIDETPGSWALVEDEPAGAPLAGSLAPDDVVRMGLAVADLLSDVHAGGRALVGMRPELTYASGTKLTGIAPRCEPFLWATTPPCHGGLACFPTFYLAPEVIAGEPVTPLADVFSLAAMLATWATGEHPFPGLYHENQLAIARGLRRPWTGAAALASIIDAALAPDPSDRASLSEVVASLRGA